MGDTKKEKSGFSLKDKFKLIHWQQVAVFLIIYDLIVVTGSYFLALWLRFDCQFSEIPIRYLTPWMQFAPIYAVVCVAVFWKLRLYQSVWRFVSFVELKKITLSTVLLGVFHTVFIILQFFQIFFDQSVVQFA